MAKPLSGAALKPGQLRLIAAIGRLGKLQSAAEALGMTQPAASRMLAEIEKLLDEAIFLRAPKGMEPTPFGALLVRRAERILAEYADMARELGEFREGLGGVARVGSVTGPAVAVLIPAVKELQAEARGAEITVEVAPSRELLRGLTEGEYDFIIGRLPPEADHKLFGFEAGGVERVAFLAHAGHPLAAREIVSLKELAAFGWIAQGRAMPIRQAIEKAFAQMGETPPRNVVETSSLLAMMALLTQSDHVAPMAREVLELLASPEVAARFVELRLDRPLEVPPYGVIWNRERALSPIAERLKKIALRRIRERAD